MGVGPLIHVPFLLEHSFSDSGFRPGGDSPPSPPGLGVGVGNFLRFWVRVVRESAARLEIVLQMRLRVSVRSRKHFLFLGIFIITLTLPPICFPLLRACLLHVIGCLCLSVGEPLLCWRDAGSNAVTVWRDGGSKTVTVLQDDNNLHWRDAGSKAVTVLQDDNTLLCVFCVCFVHAIGF